MKQYCIGGEGSKTKRKLYMDYFNITRSTFKFSLSTDKGSAVRFSGRRRAEGFLESLCDSKSDSDRTYFVFEGDVYYIFTEQV